MLRLMLLTLLLGCMGGCPLSCCATHRPLEQQSQATVVTETSPADNSADAPVRSEK